MLLKLGPILQSKFTLSLSTLKNSGTGTNQKRERKGNGALWIPWML